MQLSAFPDRGSNAVLISKDLALMSTCREESGANNYTQVFTCSNFILVSVPDPTNPSTYRLHLVSVILEVIYKLDEQSGNEYHNS